MADRYSRDQAGKRKRHDRQTEDRLGRDKDMTERQDRQRRDRDMADRQRTGRE